MTRLLQQLGRGRCPLAFPARFGWLGLGWMACLGWLVASASAQIIIPPLVLNPPNDDFTNAAPLVGPAGAVAGSTDFATIELAEPLPYSVFSHTVWYRWVAPSNGVVEMDTLDSARVFLNDTVLSVYSGTDLTNLVLIGYNDDDTRNPLRPSLDSYLTFSAIAGQVYYVRVDGLTGTYFYFHWNMPNALAGVPAPPMNPLEVGFSSYTYAVAENSPGYALITVLYSGGAPGDVSVDYATSDGTATNGVDYFGRTGTLTFAFGDSSKSFLIPVIDNALVNSNKTVQLSLSNPSGGATLGVVSSALLTILDDESLVQSNRSGIFQFSRGVYLVSERESGWRGPTTDGVPVPGYAGALITVIRTNGARGRVLVDYYVTNNAPEINTNVLATNSLFGVPREGVPFVDYSPVYGTLVFDDYQMSATFVVPVYSDGLLNGNAEATLVLVNPRGAPEEDPAEIKPQLGAFNSRAKVQIMEVWPMPPYENQTMAITTPTIGPGFERFHCRVLEPVVLPNVNRQIQIRVLNPTGAEGAVGLRWPDRQIGGSYVVDAGSTRAIEGADFATPPDRLNFGPGVTVATLTLTILDDSLVEFNEDIMLELWYPGGPGWLVPNPQALDCNVTILFDEQPPGALDRTWDPANVTFTTPPNNSVPGANAQVRALLVQPDGKTVMGGEFTHVNSIPLNRVARMNANGSVDLSFNPGTGADGFVQAIVQYPTDYPIQVRTNQLLLAGGFQSYNGSLRPSIVRVNPDGSLDPTFAPGNGADGPIRFVSLRTDGKILVGGPFTYYNDVWRSGVALLNDDGSLDLGFDPNLYLDGVVYAVAVEEPTNINSRVYMGGSFQTINGLTRRGIARLNPDGTVDESFNPGGGADRTVYSILVQDTGRIIVAGDFTTMDYRSRSGVARLNVDGSLDLTYYPGTGFDDAVLGLAPSPEGGVYFVGKFTQFNGARRVGLARLQDNGFLDTTFMDTAYNQFAGLINPFSFQPPNFVNAIAVQPDGNVMIGGSFTNLGGNAYYSPYTRADKQVRFNVARLIGTWGSTGNAPNPTQGPGNMEFNSPNYFADENINRLYITMRRSFGNLGDLEAIGNTLDRTALSNLDYIAQSQPLQTAVGALWPYMILPILDNSTPQSDRVLDLKLAKPQGNLMLGGEYIPLGGSLGVDQATVTIGDNDFTPGVFNFLFSNYPTNEDARYATITVIRTNGLNGSATVDYYTRDGTARAGSNYLATSGTLSFGPEEASRTFSIQILDNTLVEFDKKVFLVLTNATGGARLPGGTPTSSVTATLTIVDNDFASGRVNFSSIAFTNNELDGYGLVTVTRSGGLVGAVMARFATSSGTAVNGLDYVGLTNDLYWSDRDTSPRVVSIPLMHDLRVKGPRSVNLKLSNPSLNGLLGAMTNATLYITDPNSYGRLSFSQPLYVADENGGNILITVIRTDGNGGSVSVNFATVDGGTAVPGFHYGPVSGTLNFGPGVLAQYFTLPVLDNALSDGDKTVQLALSGAINATLGSQSGALLQIVDDESSHVPAGLLDSSFNQDAQTDDAVYALALQSDGRLLMAGDFTSVNAITRNHLARLKPNGLLDPSFDASAGPNGPIRAMVVQSDGRILLGGIFSVVNHTNRNNIVRLATDGTLDQFFNVGAGADNPVFAITVQPDNLILIAGGFSRVAGVSLPGIARLQTNGAVDASFKVGAGTDGPIYALALQPSDGKIIIGGNFTRFNGYSRLGIARLLPNGSLDLSFNPGAGLEGAVRALVLQPDGRLIVGGSFTNVQGVARSYLARLNSDGSLDPSFLAGLEGPDKAVYALTLQVDGRLLVGGEFARFNGVTRRGLTRLNPDGSTDPTINFGNGANGYVAALAVQSDRGIFLGGGFTTYDDQPRHHLARIFGGSIAGPGGIEFSRPLFEVSEAVSNAPISLRRVGGTTGVVSNRFATLDGTALDGLAYRATNGWVVFPEGETRVDFDVTILNQTNFGDMVSFGIYLSDFGGGAVPGPQPLATVRIQPTGATLSFVLTNSSVNENDPSRHATVAVTRVGNTNTTMTVVAATTLVGSTAAPGVRYLPTATTLTFQPAQTLQYFQVPVINGNGIEGNQLVRLILTNAAPATLTRLGLAASDLIILDDDNVVPGEFRFSVPSYTNNRSEPYATITVLRTNGSSGITSVRFSTLNGGTGVVGVNYFPTNGVLAFAEGETLKTFRVRQVNDFGLGWQGDRTVPLALSTPTGNAGLTAPTTATLTIVDNKPAPAFLTFYTNRFEANERQSYASITVARSYNPSNRVSVTFFTGGGTATPGVHYFPTNGVLTFEPNEMLKTVFVTLINTNGLVEPNRSVGLFLTNAVVTATGLADSNVVVLGSPSSATLAISDDDTGIRFTQTTYLYPGLDLLAAIAVQRIGVTNRPVSVDYYTATNDYYPGTNVAAVPGLDYLPTNGTLTFAVGVTQMVFYVPLLGNNLVRPTPAVPLVLTNVVGDAVLINRQASLVITNANLNPGVFVFATPSFSVRENGTNALISVLRTNGSFGVVSVDYFVSAGTAVAGLHYVPVAGTLTFLDGQTNQRIVVPVVDDKRTDGNKTFFVSLRAPTGGAVIAGFDTVRVTIVDDESGPGTLDLTFDPGAGADSTVESLALQPDGKVVLGGSFTRVDNVAHNHLARLLANGGLDTAFLPPTAASNLQAVVEVLYYPPYVYYFTNYVPVTNDIPAGPDGAVAAVAVQTNGAIYFGGVFTNLTVVNGTNYYTTNCNRLGRLLPDGTLDGGFARSNTYNAGVLAIGRLPRNKLYAGGGFSKPKAGVVRLAANGAVDTGFDPGSGTDGVVYAVTAGLNDTVLLGGEFSSVGGVPRARVARLNVFGAVDPGFNPPAITNGVVYDLEVQSDGKVLVGGDFTAVGATPSGRLVRLNADGSLDAAFATQTGLGADGSVYALAVQPDGKILLGGDFITFNGASRTRLARLNSDGSLDTGFVVGSGANNTVFALAVQPDGHIVLGGSFTEVYGSPRAGIARVLGDNLPRALLAPGGSALTPSGFSLSFTVPAYTSWVVAGSTNMKQWTDLATNVATGALNYYVDTNAAAFPYRFYRVRTITP